MSATALEQLAYPLSAKIRHRAEALAGRQRL